MEIADGQIYKTMVRNSGKTNWYPNFFKYTLPWYVV